MYINYMIWFWCLESVFDIIHSMAGWEVYISFPTELAVVSDAVRHDRAHNTEVSIQCSTVRDYDYDSRNGHMIRKI